MPVRIRNGASSSLSSATSSSWARSRSADSPLATVSRGEWSVSTMYSWPRSRAASAISPIGEPPSDQSEWVWQSPRSACRSATPAGVGASDRRAALAAKAGTGASAVASRSAR